jgi:pimeloyl-ACP methyl ester carboxylesterase
MTGSGPPVVLLHANGGSHHDFDAITERLAQSATLLAIDWPGHGESGDAVEPGACPFADLLPSLLEAIDRGPYTLLGNSVGGFAAIRVAARRPDLVSNLVLVDPGGFTPRWPTTFVGCRLFGSERVAPLAMRMLPHLYLRRRTPAVKSIQAAAVAASRSPNQVRTFAKVWRSFTDPGHDARVDARRINVPVLLVWGTRDPILPWYIDGRRAKRELSSAHVVKLPCGHQPFAEMPERFLHELHQFLGPKRGDAE